MGRVEELQAELKAAKFEESFLEAKARFQDGDIDYDEYRKIKTKFHEARVAHREKREANGLEVAEGDAVVTPKTIKASAAVQNPSGSN
jgi:hypothetical protein